MPLCTHLSQKVRTIPILSRAEVRRFSAVPTCILQGRWHTFCAKIVISFVVPPRSFDFKMHISKYLSCAAVNIEHQNLHLVYDVLRTTAILEFQNAYFLFFSKFYVPLRN